jgi:hypothetical protein
MKTSKVIFGLVTTVFTFIVSQVVFAGETNMGPSKAHPGKYEYMQAGCDGITNLTDNLPAGFKAVSNVHKLVVICGKLNLLGDDRVDILSQIGNLTKSCFETSIDRDRKTFDIRERLDLDSKLRIVTHHRYTRDVYELNTAGEGAVLKKEETNTNYSYLCVLDKTQLEYPYIKMQEALKLE